MLKKLISLKIAPGENRGHFTSFGVVTFFYILCRRQRPVLVDKTAKSVDLFELSAYNASFPFVTYKSCTYIRVIFCNIFDTIFTNFSFHFRNSCATILSRINISSTTICQRGGSWPYPPVTLLRQSNGAANRIQAMIRTMIANRAHYAQITQ